VALSVRDTDWAAFAELIGRAEWVRDPTLASVDGRRRRRNELNEVIGHWLRTRDAAETVDLLRTYGIPVAHVRDAAELVDDAQLSARRYFQRLARARVGERDYPTFPMRASYGPEPVHSRPAPLLGEHNREVLTGVLGLDDVEIQSLIGWQVIGTTVPT
jgi:crotonobetainyl-CoA:carnitine CoA-transferase CaiB-like acyl-CoA transferase